MAMNDSDVVGWMVHELRSPITVIRGFAEMLQEHPERQTELSEKILRGTLRLEKIIQNMLTLTDVENSVCEKNIVHLLTLASHCKEIVLEKYPDAKIAIVCDSELSIFADGDLLELALVNLLENGCKYSESQAHLQIEISRGKDGIKISVQDDGIGIEKLHLPHIFDRFYAVNKTQSRKLGGAGLGLSLVKTIVEQHGGTLSVESEYGKGSRFTILLPID